MPATPANIVLATREAALDTRSDAAVLARHAGARDTGESPRIAFWDDIGDAAIVNAAGFALVGTERRRAAVVVQDVLDLTGALDVTQATPTVTVVDAEAVLSTAMLIARVELDFESETTSLEVFG